MTKSLAEIIAEAAKLKTNKAKAEYLKAHSSTALQTILYIALNPAVVILLPEGDPPYKPNLLVDNEGVLMRECRRLYVLIEGGNPGLRQRRREEIFIEMLENVMPEDAKLLLMMKDKRMPEGITRKVVDIAFPNLIPGGTVEEEEAA
jgi:hypothetical protein